jgi:hypothetical protein
MKELELKTNNDLKEDLHAHLYSFRRKCYDPDMHVTILLGLMQEAAAEPAGERS